MEFFSHLSTVKTFTPYPHVSGSIKKPQTKKPLCFYLVYSQNVQGQTNFQLKKVIYFLSLDLWGIHAIELKAKDQIPSLKKNPRPSSTVILE